VAEPLADGAPASELDCWFRVLTNKDHWTSDGRVHHSAISAKQFGKSRRPERWAHEISGRLASLAGPIDEIKAEGEARAARASKNFADQGKPVPSKIGFHGVAFAKIATLRGAVTAQIASDVVYTPYEPPGDTAHADYVTMGSLDTDYETVRDWLLKKLRHVDPSKLQEMIAACAALEAEATAHAQPEARNDEPAGGATTNENGPATAGP
jgi:hypothetical protein